MTDRLLDTHIAIWAAIRPERLPPHIVDMLSDPADGALVSAVSIAEMTIKQTLGKLALPLHPADLCDRLGFSALDLTWRHAGGVADLPAIHRDPFDRLLIAQAITEQLPIITADRTLQSYPGVTFVSVEPR